MNENPELTPAALEELRTALLTRQAELQREITNLRQSEQGTVDHPEDVTTVDPAMQATLAWICKTAKTRQTRSARCRRSRGGRARAGEIRNRDVRHL